jgi:SAM-dependent methyltransferase
MSIAEVPKSREFSGTRTKTPPYSQPTSATQPEFAHLKSLDDLDALNFYCFGGRRSFSDGFRALVVGRGTSQSVIDLAEQLRGTGAVVVYVDESEQAIDIAQDHAKTRGVCDDIEWIQAAPLDLVGIELESFDYINCCGMLERNPEPAAALQLLKSILKPDGALGLSFQGKYGRTGISQTRDMMSLVNRNMDDAGDAVVMTRAMIDRLPATNWCKRAVDLFPIYDGLSDAEIRDLFNSQPQSVFSIPDVWDLLDTAGLILVEHTREQRALCEPQFAFPEGPLLKQIQKLPRRDQQAATELYWGAITRHTFWASSRPETVAPLIDPDMIPLFTRFAAAHNVQQSILETAGDEWSWTTRLVGEVDVSITFHVAPAARRFVELIDNRRTLAEIIETILSAYSPRPPIEEAMKISRYVMEVLLRQDLLHVRHKSTSPASGSQSSSSSKS